MINFGTPGSSMIKERQMQLILQGKEDKLELLMDIARTAYLSRDHEGHEDNLDEMNDLIKKVVTKEWPGISYDLRDAITQEMIDEMLYLGPIEELRQNKQISDILITRWNNIEYQEDGIWHTYEKNGKPIIFRSPKHLRMTIARLCKMGRSRVDESKPYTVFAADGMRVTIVTPPVFGYEGGQVALRFFTTVPTLDDLVAQGALSPSAAAFMRYLYRGKANIVFIGPMGSGKTTQIATAYKYMAPQEHPLLLEAVRECPIPDDGRIRIYLTREANVEGKGKVWFDDLVWIALTSTASRLMLSEAKGGEMFYVLQLANAGINGLLTTAHAFSAVDFLLRRCPAMLMQAPELSREYDPLLLIGNSIHFICVLEQVRGVRRYREISAVEYNENSRKPEAHPIFIRNSSGEMVPTGYIPKAQLEIMAQEMHQLGIEEELDLSILKTN